MLSAAVLATRDVMETARHHRPVEAATLLALLATSAFAGRALLRDLRLHPANYPTAATAQRTDIAAVAFDPRREQS